MLKYLLVFLPKKKTAKVFLNYKSEFYRRTTEREGNLIAFLSCK